MLDRLFVALDVSQVLFDSVELLVTALILVSLVEGLDILELLVTHSLDFLLQSTNECVHLLEDRVVDHFVLEVICIPNHLATQDVGLGGSLSTHLKLLLLGFLVVLPLELHYLGLKCFSGKHVGSSWVHKLKHFVHVAESQDADLLTKFRSEHFLGFQN